MAWARLRMRKRVNGMISSLEYRTSSDPTWGQSAIDQAVDMRNQAMLKNMIFTVKFDSMISLSPNDCLLISVNIKASNIMPADKETRATPRFTLIANAQTDKVQNPWTKLL